MVGIFSRISGHRTSAQHRPHSSLEDKERTAPDGEMVVLVPSFSGVRAMQLGVEFKPIDHPTEPRDNDQPVRCPMPEPSILNDGRIWKERFAEGMRRKNDIQVMKEDTETAEHPTQAVRKRHQTNPRDHVILPSFSAPEQHIIKMLQESNDMDS
ncbi:unnamed protein product [Victoria cruziana]